MKKTFASIIIIILITIGALCLYCSFSIYQTSISILKGDETSFKNNFARCKICGFSKHALLTNLPNLLNNANVLVLLQNNRELRPSGGFMGSYATLHFQKGVLKSWEINDIYEPDGQIKGHVRPLPPLQQAFATGDWRLPNSNWDTDFTEAAKDITWFFAKGGEPEFDAIIAVNLSLFENWIKIVGPLRLYDSNLEVTADNFYALAQSQTETDFFPGSQQKPYILSVIGKSLWEATLHSNFFDKLNLANLLAQELKNHQILVASANIEISNLLNKYSIDGSLGSYTLDYFYPVETNLGANKANCCIERKLYHDVEIKTEINVTATLKFKNNNPSSIPNPPDSWGGDYKNYQRLVIPDSATIKKLTVNGEELTLANNPNPYNPPKISEDKSYYRSIHQNFQIIGFWIVVKAQNEGEIKFTYSLPNPQDLKNYQLTIKRQPGIDFLPITITLNNQTVATESLLSDRNFSFPP